MAAMARIHGNDGFCQCLAGKAKGTLSGMCAIQCDDTRLMAKMKFSDKNTVKIRIGTFNPDVASDPIGRWNLGNHSP